MDRLNVRLYHGPSDFFGFVAHWRGQQTLQIRVPEVHIDEARKVVPHLRGRAHVHLDQRLKLGHRFRQIAVKKGPHQAAFVAEVVLHQSRVHACFCCNINDWHQQRITFAHKIAYCGKQIIPCRRALFNGCGGCGCL